MAHRDIDSLAERLKRAREARKESPSKRTYNKRSKSRHLSPSKKREMTDNLTICKETLDKAKLDLDAVILQAYKAGLPITSISEALGVKSHSYMYRKIQQLEADYKAGKSVEN